MHNVESKLWKLKELPGGLFYVTQKASNVTRYCNRRELPTARAIADMTERQFNAAMRRAFHGDA